MRLALSLCLGLVLSCAASAQQNPAYYQTGIPINSAQVPIPLGFVNALTGKAHLEIPIASVSERNGIPVTARMIYDTYLVANNGNGYQPGGWSGFIYGTEKERESVAWDTVQVACTLAQYPYGGNVKYTNFRVTDPAGTHQVVLANGTSWPGYTLKIGCYDQFGNYENPADGTSPNTSGSDVDGLGYSLQITNYNLVKAIDIDGTVFSDPSIINNQPYDTNGNIMWTANGDTLGRKVITSSSPSSCTSLNTNPVYLYVKVSDGSTQTYTLNCQTYSVISGGYPAGTVHLPSSLVLPNGTQYTFTYDTGSTGTHYAVLTGVTLPTGGTVTLASDLSSATFGGGTWAFNYVVTVAGSNSNTVTTVTGPPRYDSISKSYVNDKTVYSSVLGGMPFLRSVQYYRGSSTLLKTVNITYTGPYTAFPSTATTTLNDTGQVSKVQYLYNNFYLQNHPSQIQEWDYGASTPTRTTKVSYGIYNKPVSVGIYAGDGSAGSPLSSTTYTYDEYSANYCKNGVPMLTNVTGATSHDDSGHGIGFTSRGNVTSISRWVSGSTWVTSHRCYDTLGNVTQEVDEAGNPTNYAYTENWADTSCIPPGTVTRGYPTTITDPMGLRTKTKYYTCTGLAQAKAGENDIVAGRVGTTYRYDWSNRPLAVSYPDGGQTSYSYSDTTSPPYSTETTLITATTSVSTKRVVDGYGRTTQTQVTTDPEGIDYTDIAYDAGGRKASVSNPYRSTLDPTYGVTNYYYDALGRLTSVGQPDGSEVTTSHVGNSTTATDEAGNQRRSFFDGLGRLIQVDEPSPLVSATSGSGSISVSGSEQSTTVASAPGVGSVTMSGSERSTQTTATAGTGTVTINGAEQSTYYYPCGVSSCPTLLYDSGTVSVTVNGVTASAGYGQGDTSSSVASYLASAINSNASIPVTATIGGSVITLTAKVAGASTNYPLSATASSSYPQYFPSASFRPSPSGSTLTGGANAQTLYDTGTVTITVNGSTASTYSYGQADTATTIASGLVTRFSSSYVTATASGTVINLTAKTSGSGTNYPLSTSVTYDTNHFSSSSFTATSSGSTLTGGTTGGNVYDSGTVSVAVAGFTASTSYSQSVNNTSSLIASSLASAFNGNSSSPVTASSSGTTLTLTAKGTGAGTNYSVNSSSSTSQGAYFSQPSFSATSTTLTGGHSASGGMANPFTTNYFYDVLNNLTCLQQQGGVSTPSGTGCAYSANGDASSPWRIRRFYYDGLSRLTNASNPENGNVSYTYYSNGPVATKTAPAPNQTGSATVTTTYTYDADQRLIKKTYSDGSTPTAQFQYDGIALSGCTTSPPTLTDSNPKGFRTSMCDGSGATSWNHDVMSRIQQEQRSIGTLTNRVGYTYNLDGSLATLSYPGSGPVLTYTPSAAGRVVSAVDNLSHNYVTSATHAPQGAVSSYNLGASILGRITYNVRLQPLQMYFGTNTPSGTLQSTMCPSTAGNIMDRIYDFHSGAGDNGNVWTITNCRDGNRTANFSYDLLNRITTAFSSGPTWGEAFTMDSWGNLTNRGGVAGKTNYEGLSVAANSNNQFSGFGYDAAGNMTSNGGVSYTYDAENRLTSTAGWNYVYDGDGKRVKKYNGTTGTVYWTGNGGDPITESNLSGTMQEEYVFFNGQRVARRDVGSNTVHYYFSDHLGSASLVTDANGTMSLCPAANSPMGYTVIVTGEEESDYYPFGGEMKLCDRAPQNYKFTGKERDSESGLDYFGARHNASSLGRWMSPDIINITDDRVLNPVNTLNKYVHGGNNPLKYIDSDGRDITIFYEAGLPTGHVMLAAYNQETGDFAFMSVGPQVPRDPGALFHPFSGVLGTSEYKLPTSVDELRQKFQALTIQTTPEVAQQAIDAIRGGAGTGNWAALGNNCASSCVKLLKEIGLSPGSNLGLPWTPERFWENIKAKYGNSASPFSRFMANTIGAGSFANVHNGIDFGRPRYPTNTFDWIILMLNSAPEGTVRTREEYWIRCEKHPDTSDCKTGSSTPN